MKQAERMFAELESWYDEHPNASFEEEIEERARRARRKMMGESLGIVINGQYDVPTVNENILHMCLAHVGMRHLPAIGLLECMTGMPFGVTFLELESPMFFPSPATMDPDAGVTCALETLGWTCELWRSNDAESACGKLKEAIRLGPVLLGPLDMGFLPYDPDHQHKRGGDHFIVTLKLHEEMIQVHDPQLYPFAILPIADLMRTWNASDLGYAEYAYTMRWGFQARRSVNRDMMLDAILHTAQEVSHAHPAGPVVYGGPDVFTRVAEVLRHDPTDAFIGLLTHFALPVGARRCIDAACFLEDIGKVGVAKLLITKAEAFGQAQYRGVRQQWDHIAVLFDGLSQIEAEIIARL